MKLTLAAVSPAFLRRFLAAPLLAGRIASAVAVLLLPPFLMGCTRSVEVPGQRPRQVTVAAAADLRYALDEVIAAFQKQYPDIQVQVVYGSSGQLFAQARNKAPFDVFLSADTEFPRQLAEEALADASSIFRYARGQIVLWLPKDKQIDLDRLGLESVNQATIKTVAIANPRHAPYGRAAEAALKASGVYDQVKDRLVLGENVAQAAQFVESGAADAGIIALSLALTPQMRERGRYYLIPLEMYPPLHQDGVILRGTRDRQAAELWRAFVTSANGQDILKRNGYLPAGG